MNHKRCPYCQHLHPADDFVTLRKGKFGRTSVPQCGDCYRARKNLAASKERLAALICEQTRGKVRAYFINKDEVK